MMGSFHGLGFGMDATEEARRVAGLWEGGNKLCKVGMIGIIGMGGGIVKSRRREASFNYFIRMNFTPLFPMGGLTA